MGIGARLAATSVSAIALAGCSFLLSGDFAGDETPAEAGPPTVDANGGGDAAAEVAVVVDAGGSDTAADATDAALDPSLVAFWTFEGFDASRDTWTHVVFTGDPSASTAALYVGGKVVLSAAYYQYPGISPGDQDVLFGPYFVGSIDEVALYDRVLSTAEALNLP